MSAPDADWAPLLARLQSLLPPPLPVLDWQASAYRWRKQKNLLGEQGYLQPVLHASRIRLHDIQHVE
ncbi:MAG: hypothetical protein ACK5SR_07695, partial [Burkholderiales bacterium]